MGVTNNNCTCMWYWNCLPLEYMQNMIFHETILWNSFGFRSWDFPPNLFLSLHFFAFLGTWMIILSYKIAIVGLHITNKRSNRNESFSLDVMRCGTYSLSSGFLRRHITLCLASVLAFQNFTLFQHDLSFNRTRRVWIVSPTSKGVSYLLMVQHETKHSPRHETTEGSRFRDNSGRTSRQTARVCQNIDMVLTVAKLKGCVE